MRGRKPKPSWLKLIGGQAGHRPVNQDEPLPTGDLCAAPEWMTPSQKAEWDKAIKAAPAGLLKELDSSVLTVWVLASDMHRLASMKVAEYGAIIKAPVTGTPMQSPYVGIQNKQALLMMRAAAEMGFSPSSRSRVQTNPQKPGRGRFADLKELGE